MGFNRIFTGKKRLLSTHGSTMTSCLQEASRSGHGSQEGVHENLACHELVGKRAVRQAYINELVMLGKHTVLALACFPNIVLRASLSLFAKGVLGGGPLQG